MLEAEIIEFFLWITFHLCSIRGSLHFKGQCVLGHYPCMFGAIGKQKMFLSLFEYTVTAKLKLAQLIIFLLIQLLITKC